MSAIPPQLPPSPPRSSLIARFGIGLSVGVALVITQVAFFAVGAVITSQLVEQTNPPSVGETVGLADANAALLVDAWGIYVTIATWTVLLYGLRRLVRYVHTVHVLLSALLAPLPFVGLHLGIALMGQLAIPYLPALVIPSLLPFPLTWFLCWLTDKGCRHSLIAGTILAGLALTAEVLVVREIPRMIYDPTLALLDGMIVTYYGTLLLGATILAWAITKGIAWVRRRRTNGIEKR